MNSRTTVSNFYAPRRNNLNDHKLDGATLNLAFERPREAIAEAFDTEAYDTEAIRAATGTCELYDVAV